MNGIPGMRLGKLAPKKNLKTLRFSDYLKADPSTLPVPPEKTWREWKVPPLGAWNMYLNDQIGDCTIAEVAHTLMLVTAHTGTMVVPTDEEVLAMYEAISGYDPSQTDASGNNPTDTGCAITDVLAYWQKNGLAGHNILGWAQIDQTNINAVKQAIYIFGGVDLGVNLPNSAMDQTNANETWAVIADDGGIAGGHSVPLFGYGADGTNCITWCERQELTCSWFLKYCDEVYAVITNDWLVKSSGLAPNLLNLEALTADLQALNAA